MPQCQNSNCDKKNLSPSDIEFDTDLNVFLCQPCYVLRHPGWVPTGYSEDYFIPVSNFNYDFRITNVDGLTAKIGYRDISVTLNVPIEQVKKVLKIEG